LGLKKKTLTAPLPIPYLDSRKVGFVKLNAYLTDLAAQVEALGGGSMTAPLPIVGDSEDTWGDLLNTYLTELEGRIATTAASGGGFPIYGPTGRVLLDPSGNALTGGGGGGSTSTLIYGPTGRVLLDPSGNALTNS
jgi:hypothetical protein